MTVGASHTVSNQVKFSLQQTPLDSFATVYFSIVYVIHGESTKGFTYTFGQKTSPGMGMGTDDPWDPDPYPSGPGIRTSPTSPKNRFRNPAKKAFVVIQIQPGFFSSFCFLHIAGCFTYFMN